MTLDTFFTRENMAVILIFLVIIFVALAFADDENKRRW